MKCLEDIRLSPWNPPTGPRKLAGDLLYLEIESLEGKLYNITCCSKGFYVNRTLKDNFDPQPMRDSFKSYTLAGLLSQVSNSKNTT